MSENVSTEKAVVKKTPQELAMANGLKIYNSGVANGKSESGKEQKDPLRKRLGVMLNTIAGRKEKGKTATFKQIKIKYNAVDDSRDDYAKVKSLYETVGLYLTAIPVPVPLKKGEQPNPEPTQ